MVIAEQPLMVRLVTPLPEQSSLVMLVLFDKFSVFRYVFPVTVSVVNLLLLASRYSIPLGSVGSEVSLLL